MWYLYILVMFLSVLGGFFVGYVITEKHWMTQYNDLEEKYMKLLKSSIKEEE